MVDKSYDVELMEKRWIYLSGIKAKSAKEARQKALLWGSGYGPNPSDGHQTADKNKILGARARLSPTTQPEGK